MRLLKIRYLCSIMKTIILTSILAVTCITASSQSAPADSVARQIGLVLEYLTHRHANHNIIYDARHFGLPVPDSLRLTTTDGYGIFAYELCPEKPKGVVICLSGIENPSVTAYYGHVAEFFKSGLAAILPDLRGHGKSDGDRLCLAYNETADVKAITDYIKSRPQYRELPIIVMGVSMGGAVAIRSAAENSDIDALVTLSSFSSVEDFLTAASPALLPGIDASLIPEAVSKVVKDMFGVDAGTCSPLHAARQMAQRPVLLMHSTNDSQVPFLCYRKLLKELNIGTGDIDTLTVEGDRHFICDDFTKPAADKEYMRKLMRFLNKVTSRHPYICTDENVELMELIARMAGNSVFTDSLAPRYQADCERWFGKWRNHPAVTWMRKQLPKYGISYDAVPWMGAHLVWKDDRFDVIPNCNKEYKRWPKKAIRQFLPLLTDFYRKTCFHDFYTAHDEMNSAAVASAKRNIADYIDLDWFADFFKVGQPADFGIIVGLNNGAGSFSVERHRPGMNPEKIAVLLYAERKDGTPWYSCDGEEDKILVHEFCHSYIKPLKKYKKKGKELIRQHGDRLSKMGYGNWKNVVEETLVRASVIRYMIDHGYSNEAVAEEIRNEHMYYGFTWLPEDVEWYKGDILSFFE